MCSRGCVFCKVSRLALRTEVPHRNSILNIILTHFRMNKLSPKCLNEVSHRIPDFQHSRINSRFIVCPSPLISFFKVAFPLSSSLAQIYFGLFLSLNQHHFILQAGSSSLRSRMGDFASTSCSSVCCSCGRGCHHIEEMKDERRSLEPCCSGSLSLS